MFRLRDADQCAVSAGGTFDQGTFLFCVHRWVPHRISLVWFSAVLIALAFIDWDTTLLPDDLTLPLLGGSAGFRVAVDSGAVVLVRDGAVAGYLSLWLVYWGFKLATGKEGWGTATSNCLPPLGAWFWLGGLGPDHPDVLRDWGDCRYWAQSFQQLARGGYIPFGPFLVGAGLTAMIASPKVMLDTVLRTFGL